MQLKLEGESKHYPNLQYFPRQLIILKSIKPEIINLTIQLFEIFKTDYTITPKKIT